MKEQYQLVVLMYHIAGLPKAKRHHRRRTQKDNRWDCAHYKFWLWEKSSDKKQFGCLFVFFKLMVHFLLCRMRSTRMYRCVKGLAVLHRSSFCCIITLTHIASRWPSWGPTTWRTSFTHQPHQVEPVWPFELDTPVSPWHRALRCYVNCSGRDNLPSGRGKIFPVCF